LDSQAMKDPHQAAFTYVLTRMVMICALAVFAGTVSVNSLAQDLRPGFAVGSSGAEVTESGKAGGVRSPALTGQRRPLYRLCNSDVLEITLKGLEKQLYARGMTVPDLQSEVRDAYASILHNPKLSIALKDFEHPYFIAGGEIARPGKYDLRGETTVTEAVAIAGGFTGQAKHSQVVLFRHANEETVEARLLNLKEMLNRRDLKEDVRLRPGDMLFVPQNAMSKIHRYIPTSALGMYWNARPY
jgi:hypothetical protein